MLISLDLIKQHCRIEHDVEDELLESYALAAQTYIESQLDRRVYAKTLPEDDPQGQLFNTAIMQAMLMTIAHWYEHREAVQIGTTTKEIELGVWRLIQPYRRMGV